MEEGIGLDHALDRLEAAMTEKFKSGYAILIKDVNAHLDTMINQVINTALAIPDYLEESMKYEIIEMKNAIGARKKTNNCILTTSNKNIKSVINADEGNDNVQNNKSNPSNNSASNVQSRSLSNDQSQKSKESIKHPQIQFPGQVHNSNQSNMTSHLCQPGKVNLDEYDEIPEISEIQDCSEDIVCIKDTKNSTEQGNQNHGTSRDHAIKRTHRVSTESSQPQNSVENQQSGNLAQNNSNQKESITKSTNEGPSNLNTQENVVNGYTILQIPGAALNVSTNSIPQVGITRNTNQVMFTKNVSYLMNTGGICNMQNEVAPHAAQGAISESDDIEIIDNPNEIFSRNIHRADLNQFNQNTMHDTHVNAIGNNPVMNQAIVSNTSYENQNNVDKINSQQIMDLDTQIRHSNQILAQAVSTMSSTSSEKPTNDNDVEYICDGGANLVKNDSIGGFSKIETLSKTEDNPATKESHKASNDNSDTSIERTSSPKPRSKKKTRDKNVAFEGEVVHLSDGECAKNDKSSVEDRSVSVGAEKLEMNTSQYKVGMDGTADNHNLSNNNQRTDVHVGSNDATATIAQKAVTALQEEIEILDEMNSGKTATKTENPPLLITNNGITIYDSRLATIEKNQGQKSNYHKNQNENASTVQKHDEPSFASGIGNVIQSTLNVSSKEITPESNNPFAERVLINYRDGSGNPLPKDNDNINSSKEKEADLNIISSKQVQGNKLDFTAQTRQFQMSLNQNRQLDMNDNNNNQLLVDGKEKSESQKTENFSNFMKPNFDKAEVSKPNNIDNNTNGRLNVGQESSSIDFSKFMAGGEQLNNLHATAKMKRHHKINKTHELSSTTSSNSRPLKDESTSLMPSSKFVSKTTEENTKEPNENDKYSSKETNYSTLDNNNSSSKDIKKEAIEKCKQKHSGKMSITWDENAPLTKFKEQATKKHAARKSENEKNVKKSKKVSLKDNVNVSNTLLSNHGKDKNGDTAKVPTNNNESNKDEQEKKLPVPPSSVLVSSKPYTMKQLQQINLKRKQETEKLRKNYPKNATDGTFFGESSSSDTNQGLVKVGSYEPNTNSNEFESNSKEVSSSKKSENDNSCDKKTSFADRFDKDLSDILSKSEEPAKIDGRKEPENNNEGKKESLPNTSTPSIDKHLTKMQKLEGKYFNFKKVGTFDKYDQTSESRKKSIGKDPSPSSPDKSDSDQRATIAVSVKRIESLMEGWTASPPNSDNDLEVDSQKESKGDKNGENHENKEKIVDGQAPSKTENSPLFENNIDCNKTMVGKDVGPKTLQDLKSMLNKDNNTLDQTASPATPSKIKSKLSIDRKRKGEEDQDGFTSRKRKPSPSHARPMPLEYIAEEKTDKAHDNGKKEVSTSYRKNSISELAEKTREQSPMGFRDNSPIRHRDGSPLRFRPLDDLRDKTKDKSMSPNIMPKGILKRTTTPQSGANSISKPLESSMNIEDYILDHNEPNDTNTTNSSTSVPHKSILKKPTGIHTSEGIRTNLQNQDLNMNNSQKSPTFNDINNNISQIKTSFMPKSILKKSRYSESEECSKSSKGTDFWSMHKSNREPEETNSSNDSNKSSFQLKPSFMPKGILKKSRYSESEESSKHPRFQNPHAPKSNFKKTTMADLYNNNHRGDKQPNFGPPVERINFGADGGDKNKLNNSNAQPKSILKKASNLGFVIETADNMHDIRQNKKPHPNESGSSLDIHNSAMNNSSKGIFKKTATVSLNKVDALDLGKNPNTQSSAQEKLNVDNESMHMCEGCGAIYTGANCLKCVSPEPKSSSSKDIDSIGTEESEVMKTPSKIKKEQEEPENSITVRRKKILDGRIAELSILKKPKKNSENGETSSPKPKKKKGVRIQDDIVETRTF